MNQPIRTNIGIIFTMLVILLANTITQVFAQSGTTFSIIKVQTSPNFVIQSDNADVEKMGQWHNEILDMMLNKLITERIGAYDSRFVNRSIAISKELLDTKGIESDFYFSGDFKQWQIEQPGTLCNMRSDISEGSQDIICRMQQTIDNFRDEIISLQTLVNNMNAFILESKTIPNEEERYLVGLTASITKYSHIYWNDNFDRIYNEIIKLNQTTPSNTSGPSYNPEVSTFKIRWWGVAIADAWGAYNWGRGGAAIGGAHGAVAAGLVGACYQSGTSIYMQSVYHQIFD